MPMTVDGWMVAETFSILHLSLILLNTLHLQILLFAFMQIDASFVDRHHFLSATSKNIRNLFQSLYLTFLFLRSFLLEPMISFIYSSLRPRQKLFKRWRSSLVLDILINFDGAVILMPVLMLMVVVGKFLLPLISLLLFLGRAGIVDWLVLLIEDLVDQFLSLLLDGEMMRSLLLEVFLHLLLELKDIHFIYIFIPFSIIFK